MSEHLTDSRLVMALADLAEATDPKRRAGHLVKPARELARRLARDDAARAAAMASLEVDE